MPVIDDPGELCVGSSRGKVRCGLEARTGRDGAGGRWAVDDPHAMGARCDELCNGVGESADWRHVEDWIRVLAVVQAALGEDD
jgi:hypothetical protein